MMEFSIKLTGILLLIFAQLLEAANLTHSLGWEEFKQRYGKDYSNQWEEVEARRFGLFQRSLAEIEQAQAARESHVRGLNHMSDWSTDEFSRMLGVHLSPTQMRRYCSLGYLSVNESPIQHLGLPDELDWRNELGHLGGVEDQGLCASGWAFAAVGMLEVQQLRNTNKSERKNLKPLSKQQLVDCSFLSGGCRGGTADDAITDVVATMGGLESAQDYPYNVPYNFGCQFNESKVAMDLSGIGARRLEPLNEKIMLKMVAEHGPITAMIDASDLRDYQSGIYEGQRCRDEPETLNHSVLIVGYGTDSRERDYWIVKNSWGEHWGEGGYFRMSRGRNTCGVSLYAVVAHKHNRL